LNSHAEPSLDLGLPGVVWLGGAPVPVERTGAPKPVARLVLRGDNPGGRRTGVVHRTGVVSLEMGGPVVPDGGPASLSGDRPESGVLLAGGTRRDDVLGGVLRWYRREARERIGSVVRREGDRLGLRPRKVTIRDQKTRWGSCSTSGTLSFNWRLVIGPPEALRYVVVHELVHIRHHNHSPEFWGALDRALPGWKEMARWLRANERELTRYLPRV
jgi:hypothetical protein